MRWNCSGVCDSVFVCVSVCICISMYYCIVNDDENAIVMLSPCSFVFVSPKCHCVLYWRLYFTPCVRHACIITVVFFLLSFWPFGGRERLEREYIMLYNIIYKLHRINLCHLRHMNFTVYTLTHTHTNTSGKAIPCCFFVIIFFCFSRLYLVLSHFAGLCYYCHPVHRISVCFQHCNDTHTPSTGESVCSICHLH